MPYKGYMQKRPKYEPTDSYFYLSRHIDNCMMRAGALNSHVYPVKIVMTSMQHIHISHVCDLDDSKSKGIISDEKLSQVCSTDERKSESVIVDESYMEESESEIVHKIINTNK